MFNWVAGIIIVLIAFAFFWPQSKNTPQNNLGRFNDTQLQEELAQDISSKRTNTFSRIDDSARLKKFKEIDAFDRNIASLLEEAQTLTENLSYTLPKERNAIMVYQEVLALSPNNFSAQQGIDNISDNLLAIAYRALTKKKLSTANRTLQKLINIDQESEQTIELTAAISNWHQKKKITDLVIAGNAAFEKYNYISPATKNALYFYEKALEQDSSNKQARAGIVKIVDIYRQRTRNAIDAQLYNQASTNLEILIELDSNDPLIPGFQAVLQEILKNQQNTESETSELLPSTINE